MQSRLLSLPSTLPPFSFGGRQLTTCSCYFEQFLWQSPIKLAQNWTRFSKKRKEAPNTGEWMLRYQKDHYSLYNTVSLNFWPGVTSKKTAQSYLSIIMKKPRLSLGKGERVYEVKVYFSFWKKADLYPSFVPTQWFIAVALVHVYFWLQH